MATFSVAAEPAQSGSGFTVESLTYPGSEPLQWPAAVADRAGQVLAVSQGPVAWAGSGEGWSSGHDADPGQCHGTDLVNGPATGAVSDIAGTTTWFAAQTCLAGGFSLLVHRSTDGVRWDTDGPATTALSGIDGGFLSAGPDGSLYADGHLEGADFSALVVSRSTDGGRSFAPPVLINRSPSGLTSGCGADLPSIQACAKQNIADQSANTPTPVVVDPREPRRLYLVWTAVAPADFPGGSGIFNPW